MRSLTDFIDTITSKTRQLLEFYLQEVPIHYYSNRQCGRQQGTSPVGTTAATIRTPDQPKQRRHHHHHPCHHDSLHPIHHLRRLNYTSIVSQVRARPPYKPGVEPAPVCDATARSTDMKIADTNCTTPNIMKVAVKLPVTSKNQPAVKQNWVCRMIGLE